MEMSASRLSGSLLTPSTVDDVSTSACNGVSTPPSVDKLKDAYHRASHALATENLPTGFLNEPASWGRKLEIEEERHCIDRMGMLQGQRIEEQLRKVFRDIAALRQDVDTVMLLSSKAEAQQVEANRSWSMAQSNLAKESMDLLIHVTEEQKLLKEEFRQESPLRAQMEERIRQEAMLRTEMAESMAKDREKADADIISSIRQVVEQGAAFREVVLKEAAEQRAALAKEMQSSLERTLEHSITDLRTVVHEVRARCLQSEQDVASCNQKLDCSKDVLIQTLVDGFSARCSEAEKNLANSERKYELQEARLVSSSEELRNATQIVEAQCLELIEELNGRVQDVKVQASDGTLALRKMDDHAKCRAAQERESTAFMEQFSDKIKEQLCQSEEAMAVVAENLKEEIKERTLLNGRLRSEADQRTKVTSAVWLEVANVQQQVAELRESVRLEDNQGHLAQHKGEAEMRHGSLMTSLEDWKQTISTSFDKHKTDMSALRDHMTNHMAWVAETHEAAVGELKEKVSSNADQIQELRDIRCRDSKPTNTSRSTTPTPSTALVTRRSSANIPTVPAMTQLQRPTSPMRGREILSLPHPPMNSYASGSGAAIVAHATAHTGASITVSASGSDPSLMAAGGRGVLQRVPSTGLLSARFVGHGPSTGPSRGDGRR